MSSTHSRPPLILARHAFPRPTSPFTEVVRLFSGSLESPPVEHVPLMEAAAKTQIAERLNVAEVSWTSVSPLLHGPCRALH
jgi:hypothetical protein